VWIDGFWGVAAVSGVVFLATLVRSTLGFGEALVGVPLLALLLPVKLAAPLAVLVSITVSALILAQDFRKVHLRSAGWLVASSALGIPLGLLLLERAPEAWVKGLLAGVILAFCAYSLGGGTRARLEDDRLAWAFGFGAGVLGGAYGMNGPPLAVYGSLRRWSPSHFRATLQGYFLIASALGMVGYGSAGLWTRELNHLFAWSLPGVVAAVWLGRALHHRLEPERFQRVVYWALCGVGLALLAEALRTP
jgi:uncharacterized membrane protein YfcA